MKIRNIIDLGRKSPTASSETIERIEATGPNQTDVRGKATGPFSGPDSIQKDTPLPYNCEGGVLWVECWVVCID